MRRKVLERATVPSGRARPSEAGRHLVFPAGAARGAADVRSGLTEIGEKLVPTTIGRMTKATTIAVGLDETETKAATAIAARGVKAPARRGASAERASAAVASAAWVSAGRALDEAVSAGMDSAAQVSASRLPIRLDSH